MLKLRIPPAFVFIIFAGGMYLLDFLLPVGDFDFYGRRFLMYFLWGAGSMVGALSLLQFARHRTSIDPLKPVKARVLVTGGLYHYSRNPMYLGLLLFLLGWGLYLGNAFNTLLAAGFVAYMNAFQILPEEEALEQAFGTEYKQYCSLVRRWF